MRSALFGRSLVWSSCGTCVSRAGGRPAHGHGHPADEEAEEADCRRAAPSCFKPLGIGHAQPERGWSSRTSKRGRTRAAGNTAGVLPRSLRRSPVPGPRSITCPVSTKRQSMGSTSFVMADARVACSLVQRSRQRSGALTDPSVLAAWGLVPSCSLLPSEEESDGADKYPEHQSHVH